MTRRYKLLSGLSTLTLAGALALSACAEGEGEGEGAEGEGAPTAVSEGEGAEGAGGESEGSEGAGGESEGGEGEGGESEGEGSSGADPATDDVEYLLRLGLVRGHMFAFNELHAAGAHDLAMTHAKHPGDELYADLEPAFAARGKPGFADGLSAIADAATSGGDVDAAYEALKASIIANAPTVSFAERLLAIAGLARTAGEEFVIGVEDDGTISNAHEYQDAYGFLNAAQEILAEVEPEGAAESAAAQITADQLAAALADFGELTAEQTTVDSTVIYGAAARIEIAALGLQ